VGSFTGTSESTFGWIAAVNLVGSTEPNAEGTAVVRIARTQGWCATGCTPRASRSSDRGAHPSRRADCERPVVVPFQAPAANGNSDGCVTATAALIDEIIATPANFYVNVHTTEHPAGAMRAQLG